MLNFFKSRNFQSFIAIFLICACIGYLLQSRSSKSVVLDVASIDVMISDIIAEPKVKEFVYGQQNIVRNKDVDIWYEVIKTTPNPIGTVVLIMGVGGSALSWPEHFFAPIVAAGYQVIRLDNRGVGMSSWMPNWSIQNSYSLMDMASDVIAILDQERVEKAHFVGMSMGGMIAQELGMLWPHRVQSLTLMSSAAYLDIKDEYIYGDTNYTDYMIKRYFGKTYPYPSEEYTIHAVLALMIFYAGGGDYQVDVDRVSRMVLYELRNRRGFNALAKKQHMVAIKNSGSRLSRLDQIQAPTLVVHGDEDPVMPIQGAKYYASLIPNAEGLWVEGLGHSIPKEKMPIVLPKVLNHIQQHNVIEQQQRASENNSEQPAYAKKRTH